MTHVSTETPAEALEILHTYAIERASGGAGEMTRLARIVTATLDQSAAIVACVNKINCDTPEQFWAAWGMLTDERASLTAERDSALAEVGKLRTVVEKLAEARLSQDSNQAQLQFIWLKDLARAALQEKV